MHPTAEAHLAWYFESNIWKGLSYRGVRTLKFPSDMWNYQEILFEHDIQWIVETGTRHGGSALFFADLMEAKQAEGKVITIDPFPEFPQHYPGHPRIEFLPLDSGAPETVEKVRSMLPEKRGKIFMIFDSDHSAAHVKRELDVWVPFLKKGDYLLVEDTIVNGHPVRPDFGPGPLEAVQEYAAAHPGQLIPDLARQQKFGASFAWGGYFIKA